MFEKKLYAFFHSFLLNGFGQSSLQTFKGQKHIQHKKTVEFTKTEVCMAKEGNGNELMLYMHSSEIRH